MEINNSKEQIASSTSSSPPKKQDENNSRENPEDEQPSSSSSSCIKLTRRFSTSENVVSSSNDNEYSTVTAINKAEDVVEQNDEMEKLSSSTEVIPQYSRLFLGGEWVDVPNVLISDEFTFRSVISERSFHSLSPASKNHLMRYLPVSFGNSFGDMLACTFTKDQNFFFGNPVQKFFNKIRDGYFSAIEQVQLRDHKRVLYDHYIRHYQMSLLKQLLISRHALLELASGPGGIERLQQYSRQQQQQQQHKKVAAEGGGAPSTSSVIKHLLVSGGEHTTPIIKPSLGNQSFSKRRLAKHSNVRRRAKLRARIMIDDCRVKAGQNTGHSSDESSPDDSCSAQPLPPNTRSTMFVEKFAADLDLYQPIQMREVSDLYREYRHLREVEPDCPSLDISDIALEEVYERTGISFQTERNFFKITEQNLAQMRQQQLQKEKQSEQQQQQQQQKQQPYCCNGVGSSSSSSNGVGKSVGSTNILTNSAASFDSIAALPDTTN